MRKNIFMVAIATLVVCSCGSSKKIGSSTSSYNTQLQEGQTTASGVTRTKRAKEPCIALAQERDFAAYGTATSYVERVAMEEARNMARQELGRMMKTAVEGATEDYLKNAGADGKSTAETLFDEVNNSFWAESVKNSKEIETSIYDMSDGQIQVYVCYEVRANFDVLDKTAEVINNVLSNDKKLEIEFDKEQFKKKMASGLKEYKESLGKE